MPAPSPGFKNSGVLVPEECTAPGVGTRQTFDDSLQMQTKMAAILYCARRDARGAAATETAWKRIVRFCI